MDPADFFFLLHTPRFDGEEKNAPAGADGFGACRACKMKKSGGKHVRSAFTGILRMIQIFPLHEMRE